VSCSSDGENRSNHALRSENNELKKNISFLKEQMKEMSKSLAALTEELSLLRKSSAQTPAAMSFSFPSPTDNALPPGLIQIIESAIMRIVPTIMNRQMMCPSQLPNHG
jgi:hypothetical protein